MNLKRLLCLVTLSSLATALHADGDGCPLGERPPNAAEQQFPATIRKAMSLLPPAPAGWVELRHRESDGAFLSASSIACVNPKPSVLSDEFGRTSARYTLEQWTELLTADLDRKAKFTASSPIGQKLRAIDERNMAAIQAGNIAAITANQEQRDALDAQLQLELKRLDHAHPDSFVEIKVGINQWEGSCSGGKARKISVAGAAAAAAAAAAAICTITDGERTVDEYSEQENATAVIGFGPFKAATVESNGESASAVFEGQANPKRAYTEVQSVVITLNAAPESIEKYIAGADWSRLAGLVK